MNHEEWEAICRRCGKCCYEKIDLGEGVIKYTDVPCKYLDTESKLCKVYPRRHEVEPECISLTVEVVKTIHWLPPDCAYQEWLSFRDTLEAVRSADRKNNSRYASKRRR
jgi:hypothetical protein